MALYTDYTTVDTTVTDAAAINDAIRNILMTREGSLPGKPTFGSRIHEVVFEQDDTITSNLLASFITDALYKWEQRIIVENVQVKSVPEYSKMVATINYRYRDKGLDVNSQISVAFTK